jgi:hypothetical protein
MRFVRIPLAWGKKIMEERFSQMFTDIRKKNTALKNPRIRLLVLLAGAILR